MAIKKKKVSRAAANRGSSSSPPTESDPVEPGESIEEEGIEVSTGPLPKSCHHTFNSFLERNHLTQEMTTAYIYKIKEVGGGRMQCDMVAGEMPSEHEIGIKNGGGKYQVILQAIDSKGKAVSTSKTFELGPNYDGLKQLAGSNPMMFNPQFSMPRSPAVASNGQASNLHEMLGLMQAFMGILSPLLQGKQQSQPEYMGAMFADNFKMMNNAMKDVYADTSQFMKDQMRESAGAGETAESESEVTGMIGVMGMMLPLLEKLLPAVLSPKKSESQLAVETIKAIPQFQKFAKDRKMIKELIQHIYATHGEDAARLACKRFNIRYANPEGNKKQKVPSKPKTKPVGGNQNESNASKVQ